MGLMGMLMPDAELASGGGEGQSIAVRSTSKGSGSMLRPSLSLTGAEQCPG